MPFGLPSSLRPFYLVSILCAAANASPSTVSAGPTVTLSYGSFQGNVTNGGVVEFLGMPFAAPPIGNLRFAPPQPPLAFRGVRQATSFGPACFQQFFNTTGLILSGGTAPSIVSEDCLFINVVKPANLPIGKRVPVLFWIYGGGFEVGDTSLNPGNTVVARAIALGEPVIYVSANYRLNAFGFLAGKEVKAAGIGNAGLRDQRFAMQWIQSHITAFGGDPTKVTIWGESAGAISVSMQLLANDGNPGGLFRGAVMESGFPSRLPDTASGQPAFDQLVTDTGCTGSRDPIACLRGVPFAKLSAAVNLSPSLFSFQSLRLTWGPSIDGQFIARNPEVSVQKGLYAKVPLIMGDCDDEGTLFSQNTLNLTTNAEFLAYMQSNYFPGIQANELAAVGEAYPDDVTQGSPFDTGTANAITPQFKRIAAIQGDLVFQAPRRLFLQTASKTQKTFAFLFKRGKATAIFGAFHSTDIPEFYGAGDTPDFIGTDALVNFASTGNPNMPNNPISLLSKINWPAWTVSSNPPLLTFLDPAPTVAITPDTFRGAAMQLLTKISLEGRSIF